LVQQVGGFVKKVRRPKTLILEEHEIVSTTYDYHGQPSIRFNDKSLLCGAPSGKKIAEWLLKAVAWIKYQEFLNRQADLKRDLADKAWLKKYETGT
jgi:hypothetical protein